MLHTLLARFRNRLRGQRGQGMTEYIIIVSLIAIAAIGVIKVFGSNIQQLFIASSNSLANQATANPGTKVFSGTTNKDLSTFGDNQVAGGGGGP